MCLAANLVGWALIWKCFLWCCVGVLGLGALCFAGVALDAKTDSTGKPGLWVFSGVAGLLALVAWWFVSASGPSTSAVNSVTRQATPDSMAGRTLEYWKGLLSATQKAPPESKDSTTLAKFYRETAVRVRRLPAAGVDADAISCGNDMATFLSNAAAFAQRNDAGSAFVESLLRGAAGDPFGKFNEVKAEHLELERQARFVDEKFQNTRTMLSSRYQLEFPGGM